MERGKRTVERPACGEEHTEVRLTMSVMTGKSQQEVASVDSRGEKKDRKKAVVY